VQVRQEQYTSGPRGSNCLLWPVMAAVVCLPDVENPNCWAKSLGDCATKLTREHTFSEGLFLSDTVWVHGLPWCKDEPKNIGIAALTRKILCDVHNHRLSGLADDPAIDAIRVFRDCGVVAETRRLDGRKRFRMKRYTVDGLGFERWFLKTLVNVSFEHSPIGPCATSAREIPQCVVDIAFGLASFSGHAGLYMSVKTGQVIQPSEKLQIRTLISGGGYVSGGMFSFRGLRFLLWLDADNHPGSLWGLGIDDENWGEFGLVHRVRLIKESDVRQQITFTWK
jgi:hypothetical protein